MLKKIFNSVLFRNSQIYIIGNIANCSLSIILLPIITRYLTPADYGIVSMFQISSTIMLAIIGLSIPTAISVKYFDKENQDLPNYIGNCLLLIFLNTLIAAFVFRLFATPISNLSAIPKNWLWAILFYCLGQSIIMAVMILWLVQSKAFKYISYQVLQAAFNLTLSILLIVGFNKKWEGRIEAQLVTVMLFAVVGLVILYRNGWLRFSYDLKHIMRVLKFGIPLIPRELGALLVVSMDKILLTNMKSIGDTGIYTVGFQIAIAVELIAMSFNRAYLPWLFDKLKQGSLALKIKIVKFTYLFFTAMLALAIILGFSATHLLHFIVGKDFMAAEIYIRWLMIAFAFSGMNYMVSNFILFTEKTYLLTYITSFIVLISFGLNFFLIKINGALGAAQAITITFFIDFVLTWFLSSKVYKMPWLLKES